MKATLRLEGVTKGAVRYQEIDSNGNDLKMFDPNTLIGTQYLRQGKFKNLRDHSTGEWPQKIIVTVTTE
jgi:hypothetical protein